MSSSVLEQKPVLLREPEGEAAARIKGMCNKLLDIPEDEKSKIGIAKVLLSFIKSKKNNG